MESAIKDVQKVNGECLDVDIDKHLKEKSMPPAKFQSDVVKVPTWFVGAFITLFLAFIGTLLVVAQWKGGADEKFKAVEEKFKQVEERAREDREYWKEQLGYIRTQNEVSGKDLARIKVYFEEEKKRR